MTMLVAWESADFCPDCGARLVLLDDGIATAGLECRSCGYLDTWTLTSRDGGEQ
jgi:DNA-directed RNA polymerase subunit M/transcription elongation factor TFIIS